MLLRSLGLGDDEALFSHHHVGLVWGIKRLQQRYTIDYICGTCVAYKFISHRSSQLVRRKYLLRLLCFLSYARAYLQIGGVCDAETVVPKSVVDTCRLMSVPSRKMKILRILRATIGGRLV